MKEINFISSGMMGDFIHNLSVVKNICEAENAKANIYLTDDVIRYGYDHWRFGAEVAHRDLYDLVINQSYVNKFEASVKGFEDDYINLNNFRNGLKPPYKTWTKLLSSTWGLEIPKEYKWINVEPDIENRIIIHSSDRRKNPSFSWDKLLENLKKYHKSKDVVFMCSRSDEFYYDYFQNHGIAVTLVDTISEMADQIASAKYFIGNQSAPFALASALDVPRLVILDEEPAPFYMGEQEFSENISWYLNDSVKYKADNCIISI